jgi:hypothetical protein
MFDRQNGALDQTAANNSASALGAKVHFLGRPESYIPRTQAVIARETHMSWIFMAGERVC